MTFEQLSVCISVCDLNTTVFSHSKTHHLQSYMPTQSGCVSGQTAFSQVWREGVLSMWSSIWITENVFQ